MAKINVNDKILIENLRKPKTWAWKKLLICETPIKHFSVHQFQMCNEHSAGWLLLLFKEKQLEKVAIIAMYCHFLKEFPSKGCFRSGLDSLLRRIELEHLCLLGRPT